VSIGHAPGHDLMNDRVELAMQQNATLSWFGTRSWGLPLNGSARSEPLGLALSWCIISACGRQRSLWHSRS